MVNKLIMLYYIIAIVLLWMIFTYYNRCSEGYENKNKTVIYWFHRPKCPYCEQMKDEWTSLTKSGLPDNKYKLIAVNTADSSNNTVAADFGIESVPHIVKVLPDGSRAVYSGNRTAADMKKWALK